MDKHNTYKLEIGGREFSFETGKYCSHANGTVLVRCGETVVMVNVTMAEKPREGIDFFPLGVDFEEKMYSVGRIPGGFKRREGKASDKGILTGRLIDRPLRPLFPKGFRNDVAVVATALSVEADVYPEPLAMIGSSFALTMSDIPFGGPVGNLNVGFIDGKYIANPTPAERAKSSMLVTVSGTKDAILMVEAGANEVSEKEMLGAIAFAHAEIKKQCDFQLKVQKEIGKPKNTKIEYVTIDEQIEKETLGFAQKLVDAAYSILDREKRNAALEELEEKTLANFEAKHKAELLKEDSTGKLFNQKKVMVADALYNIKKAKMRQNIIEKGVRPDGRKLTEIREIWCETGLLPRVHGSAVFTRGQTQALTTTTLSMLTDMQELEGLDEETTKRYMHHYNMPPYSTGEAKQLRGAGRREIGHGSLAERALEPVLPNEEEFPYAIRTVSEILSSNGSTSQASVCGSSLSLMDAGVPIKAPVAGIAMGLIKEGSKVAVLTDIQGLEDFFGDMDFKVAGTSKGITAIQMDMKISGIDNKILTDALAQAHEGRMFILGKMNAVLSAPRSSLSKYAPKIISFSIHPDKIREVIGSGGKVINKIIEQTGVKIDINDDGVVCIATADEAKAAQAKSIILTIAEDVKPGTKYTGKVVKIASFGAFVELAPGKDGMVHISKLSDKRVDKVEDVVKEGDIVDVEVIKVDEKGRIDLKRLLSKAELEERAKEKTEAKSQQPGKELKD